MKGIGNGIKVPVFNFHVKSLARIESDSVLSLGFMFLMNSIS